MTTRHSAAIDHLVGVPWQDRGRTLDGCDCWGLARLALREVGIDLPSYEDGYADTSDAAINGLIDAGRSPWLSVTIGSERPFDLVLLHQAPWHIGIVVGRGLMLHMPENDFSRVEPFTTGRYGRRLEGIYRHPSRLEV